MSFHPCPCCRLPTLEEATGDTCPLCFWEDAAGANEGYSLAEARVNFTAHGHMFRAEDPQAPRIGKKRERLLTLARTTPFDAGAYRAWLDDWNDWAC